MHASLRQESCEVLRCYYHLLFLWPVISQQIAVQGRYFSLTGAIADLFWGCVIFEHLLNNAQTAFGTTFRLQISTHIALRFMPAMCCWRAARF